ncbi:MAG: GSCFA domain-containing protein [Bacteroidia bacterium]|jgi:hypothetical protein|nr:GSCFA domain-containing protein [Bacteroidia bacterium]
MNLMLPFEPKPIANPLSYNQPITLIGSCFAQHIGQKLVSVKWPSTVNPLGIAFDPLSLCRQVQSAQRLQTPLTETIFNRYELWHSWHHHSSISAYSKEALVSGIEQAQLQLNKGIQQSALLIVTLGTAYVYVHNLQQLEVSNCHKEPAQTFTKKLLSIGEVINSLNELAASAKAINPNIQITVTVSPVKHIRDGIIENTRSKALLLAAAHEWCEQNPIHANYFPAFEWVTEVLRDYRFYEADLAHPNQLAIDMVFDSFVKTYVSNNSQANLKLVQQFKQGLLHKPLFPKTEGYRAFLDSQKQKLNNLKYLLPFLNWEEETAQLNNAYGL